MANATITVYMTVEEKSLIASYAKTLDTTASEFMRRCALDRIEDELNLTAWEASKAESDAV